MDLLIRGGVVITLDDERRIQATDIAILEGRIIGFGAASVLVERFGAPLDEVDATGRHVIPGLVNAHTHLFQSGLRGFGDGMSLHQWRNQVTRPVYKVMTAEDAYWFTLMGCLENIRSGVTTVVNFQAYPNDFTACSLTQRAVGEAGLRGLLVKSCYGSGDPRLRSERAQAMEELRAAFEQLDNGFGGRVRIWAGFPTAMHAPGDWIAEAHSIAKEFGAGLHVHVAETDEQVADAHAQTGGSEVALLDSVGVIDDRFQAAHCVAISPEDLETLAACGATAVHCPVSNMYLGSGIADTPGMLESGLNVALGTDGSATNNNQDMFTVMRATSLLQRAARRDPTLMPPGQVLELATLAGARAAHDDTGVLAVGRKADIAIVDLSGLHNQPLHRPVSALTHSAHVDDVETVIVDGRVVMRDRMFAFVDDREVLRETSQRSARIGRESGLAKLTASWPWS